MTALVDAGVCGDLPLAAFGELAPVSRAGGQGRVFAPSRVPPELGPAPVVVKLYRRPPPAQAAAVLSDMVTWSRALTAEQYGRLHGVAAWPVAVVNGGPTTLGIVMSDLRPRFAVPFWMPSGRQSAVLLSLEHLLGSDAYLQQRGLTVVLDTVTRARVAGRISAALAFLHRHGIVVSDIAPNNVLVAFGPGGPSVSFIDCDSMVFHGRRALAAVQTGDWQIPPGFCEPAHTRAADAYKLGLVILRLFARSHDARALEPHVAHVPRPLRDLVGRSLAASCANRPPAGEWQRALAETLAAGALNERYPGPRPSQPAPLRSPRHRTSSPGWVGSRSTPAWVNRGSPPAWATRGSPPVWARRSSPPAWASRGSPAPATRPARRPPPSRHVAGAMWMVAALIVFALILARLIAAAAPSPDASGFGAGFDPGQARGASPYYQYAPAPPGHGDRLP